VTIKLRGGAHGVQAEQLEAIITAGHPVHEMELGDKYDLGAEFFRWQFAALVAASLLGVDPSSEPDIGQTTRATARILDEHRQTGKLLVAAAAVDPSAAAITSHLASARPCDYIAITAFFQPTPERDRLLGAIRTRCRDRLQLATTVGYGPRSLYATGQSHLGGPDTGVFLQLATAVAAQRDLPIPDEPFTFGELRDAQGLSEIEALQARGRRVLRVELGADPDAGLAVLLQTLSTLGR
jgi:hypothetical protein